MLTDGVDVEKSIEHRAFKFTSVRFWALILLCGSIDEEDGKMNRHQLNLTTKHFPLPDANEGVESGWEELGWERN